MVIHEVFHKRLLLAYVELRLLTYIEQAIAATGGRVVVIETSDQELLARARAFYIKAGYVERGRIPNFYAPGEAKVIFSRTLVGEA